MRRVLSLSVCALSLIVALAAASPAAADPDPDKAGGIATLECGEDGSHEAVVKNGGIHLVDGTSMFVPKQVWLQTPDGEVMVFLASGAVKKADVMCTWVGPLSGREFRAAGFFTPVA